jgi:hypothetical protein
MHKDHSGNEIHSLSIIEFWLNRQSIYFEQVVQLILTCRDISIEELKVERSEGSIDIK